jgi:hypothetical protein
MFDNTSVFYTRLFDVRLPEDGLKRIETCRSISQVLRGSVYFNTCAIFDIIDQITIAMLHTESYYKAV